MNQMRIPKIIKATYKGILLLGALAFLSGVIFFRIEGQSLENSIYWALITMTTVGYGDVSPGTTAGKVVSVLLALFGIFLYGYLGAVVMSIVMENSLSGVFGMKKCKFKNHFLICGWTPVSEVVLLELITANREVAVITEEKDEIPIIKRIEENEKVFPIYGDPSKSEILHQANIKDARVIILSMEDDSKNLITALHIGELNPRARIIVKTGRAELKKTMKIAGVTYVVTPHEMAGRLIASAAFEPEVANFVEDVTTGVDADGYDLRQYTISSEHQGTVAAISKALKERTKTTLVAVGTKTIKKGSREEKWEVFPNPDDQMMVKPGNVIIILGNNDQFKKVSSFLGITQGR
jgi:voltage-gated potassium channel